MKDQENNKLKNIQEHIIFLGNRNDVYRFYNAMDIFVLTSRYEGLPVVGVEAQANGLPCLLSDKMTKETKMTDNTEFLSIENSVADWVRHCLSDFRRYDNSLTEVQQAGFDIKCQADKLVSYYFKTINFD